MRLENPTSLSTLALTCSLLVLPACPGDDGPSGDGGSGSSGTTSPATDDNMDTTNGPMETTTDGPTTTGVDTTAGEESTTTGPPPGGAVTFRLNSLELTDPRAGLAGGRGLG